MGSLAAGRDTESDGRGRFMDGHIWTPCPQTKGGLPRPSLLVATLESGVVAPTRGVYDSTIAGSPRGSSATDAGLNAIVSCTSVEVRSTVGPPTMVIITGTIASVPVYSEWVLDACLGAL